MNRYRIHFEPIDVEADSPEDAIKLVDEGKAKAPDVRAIYPVDEYGFPIQ